MIRTLLTSVVFFCLTALFAPDAEVDSRHALRFLRDDDTTCSAFAKAVNHYVEMGEVKAISDLKVLATRKTSDRTRAQTRMAFLCRVLFEPKGKEPLYGPRFGGLPLPRNTMPRERWPLYPVVRAGSSFFLLSEGYHIDGLPESPEKYLAYCCSEGRFRKDRVPVPTREQALRDLESLRQSEAWKALAWIDSGQGFSYELCEQSVIEDLQAQAR